MLSSRVYQKKRLIAVLTLSVCMLLGSHASNDELSQHFNSNLTDSDKASLASGEMVIRACSSEKNLSGQEGSRYVKSVLNDLSSFKPNYIAEVVKTYPLAGNEDMVSKFESMLMNIPARASIPYYSNQNKKQATLDLTYKNLSAIPKADGVSLHSDFTLAPFGLISTDMTTEKTYKSYIYHLVNTNKIRYKDFITCVGKNNMKLSLALFKGEDLWIVYGFVAANAPSIFFIRHMVEAAIVERAQAFCLYFFKQLD